MYMCVYVLRVMVHRFAFFLYLFFDLFCSFFLWRGIFFSFLLICFILGSSRERRTDTQTNDAMFSRMDRGHMNVL